MLTNTKINKSSSVVLGPFCSVARLLSKCFFEYGADRTATDKQMNGTPRKAAERKESGKWGDAFWEIGTGNTNEEKK